MLRTIDELERAEARRLVAEESVQLGIKMHAQGRNGQVVEAWVGGESVNKMEQKMRQLNEEHEKRKKTQQQLLKRRKALQTEIASKNSATTATASSSSSTVTSTTTSSTNGTAELEKELQGVLLEEMVLRVRLGELRKEIAEGEREAAGLELRRKAHDKETRRIKAENVSRFKDNPLSNERYLLLSLCGTGGFSEVYRAYDLQECCYVACKVHQSNIAWDQERLASFVRHAGRECRLQHQLDHPRIVKFLGMFELDKVTMATVLEFCPGKDLDTYLKNNSHMPEAEAKAVIAQVFDGLVYLHAQAEPIIHYDLKPANILYHDGQVKLTDFGLSKTMAPDTKDIDLTSTGAGTYWYLPPECFKPNARISPKVDIWSAGVTFFQLLTGKKPFAGELSQAQIWRTSAINAADLSFPDKPKISDEAKRFISACFAHEPEDRPDANACLNDPYLGVCLTTK